MLFKSTLQLASSVTSLSLLLGSLIQGLPNTFFLENALKKLRNIFSNFFRLIIENNFIQMAALAGHAVAYNFSSIFKHIIDCVQLYFINGFTNIVF